jgi:hypothetical protein
VVLPSGQKPLIDAGNTVTVMTITLGASGRHRRTLQARIFSRAQPQVGKDEPVREVQCRQHATVVEKIMAVFGRVLASEGKAEDATAHSAF